MPAARAKFLFGVQNSRKALMAASPDCLTPICSRHKIKAEEDFTNQLAGKPEFMDALAAYDKIARATEVLAAQSRRYGLLEESLGFTSDSFPIARTLLRAGDERPKPNGDRLREFSDSGKVSLELSLFSEKPIYTDLEMLTLSASLTFLATQLGADDPLVQQVLAEKSPHERAVELIESTKVRNVAFRKQLYDGGAGTVAAANDPMIELARMVDPEARSLRKVAEEQDEVKQEAHAVIARARNALLGTAGYPDATFTLRLALARCKATKKTDGTFPPSPRSPACSSATRK